MANVSRSRITSYSPEMAERRAAKPAARKAAPLGIKPLAGAARFVTTRGERNLRLRVAALPADIDDPADDARTAACLSALRDRYVEFRDGAYVTKDEAVINWLRGRLALNRLRGVEEDISMLDIRCPSCDETFKNTAAGHKELARHTLTAHQAQAEGAAPEETA